MQSTFSTSIIIWCILSVGVLASGQQAAAQDATSRRSLKVDDFFALKQVRDPQISPDGQWVAYTETTTDLKADKRETRIWMKPINGGEVIPMTAPGYSASQPRWSPDGSYLSFLAARDKQKTQVWTLNRKGGDAQPLTDIKQGVSGHEWSPDGTRMVLQIKEARPEKEDKTDTEEEEKPEPWVVDRLQMKRDYAGYLDSLNTHLHIFNLKDKKLTQITSGPYNEGSPVWSPDGKRIAFVSNRTDNPDGNDNTDLWIVGADNTDKGQTLLQVTTNPGQDGSPTWSPDGKHLAYVTVTQPEIIWYATNHLAVVSVEDQKARVLTKQLDRNVSQPRFAADGQSIYFLLEDSAERHLAHIGADGKNLRRVVAGHRSVQAFDRHPEGTLVTLVSEPHLPGDIFVGKGEEVRALTHANKVLLDSLMLAEVENIHFKSRDGTEIEGFLYKPPGFDSALKYPTLLRIHGGPVSQYDARFNFEAQLFAANGYVVVTTNPRGSSGYGQDFSYALWQDWGNKDFEDVMAGIDYAIEQGYSDPARLGVGGWSYGGILTNYVITKTERFKGAVSGASEVLYVANYGHDHYQYAWEKELGLPWENREAWERISPFNDVERIVTPTLIMGGEKDWNVPILNSEQLYQALKRLGRTTQLVVYPGEHHGISRPSFQKDRYERYLDWYERFVK